MKSNNNSSATLTEKRIASAKGLHLICAIAAMVLNIISFVVVAINVSISEMTFLMFPFALAVLDIVFLVKVILSNYRFAYAVKGAIIHAAIVFAVSAIAYVVMGVLRSGEGIVFVNFALYAMIVVHVIQSVATIVTALYATKGGRSFRKILGVLLTVVFVAAAGIYGRFLLVEGFFGQGGYAEYRTVVYKYNDDGTYTATNVLGGYGKNVVIPHQFNGKHVSQIDCALFAHEELASVKVDCDHKTGCNEVLSFVGAEHLNFINENIKVFAPKGFMDSFRKSLYAYAIDDTNAYAENALKLANHVYPDDIKETEVYVSFGYDAETLRLVGVENIIPLWVKDKGTAFNILEHAGASIDYIENSDVDNPVHLNWCHNYLNEKIFKCIVDSEGNELNGNVNESVVNAQVTFENLYHIRFVDDADEKKWNIDNTQKFMYASGSDKPVCEYIITTAGKIQSKLDSVTRRNGFELAFKTGSGENKRDLENIENEIAMLDSAGSRDLYVYLDWTLLPPSISKLTANGSDEGCTVVYGSDVALSSAASHTEGKISLKYEWLYNGKVIAEGSSHELENIYPNSNTFGNTYTKAGKYTLRVTAGGGELTSLTSVSEKTVDVKFEKKALNFVWVLPEGNDAIYSATDKNDIIEGTTFVVDDVINGDIITFDICHNTATNNKTIDESPVRNANVAEEKYKLLLKLREGTEAAELYAIVNPDAEFKIEPYAVDVVWDEKVRFEYNGFVQAPETLALSPLNENIVIEVKGGQQNYSIEGYTATAVTNNTNYKLGNTERHFEITKRPITVSGWSNSAFDYNGAKQYPKVSAVNNLANGQGITNIANDIIYTDINLGDNTERFGVYVGTYKVAVSLPEIYNYEFTGTVEQEYTISPVDLAIKITGKSMVYNGKVYGNENFTFTYSKTEVKGEDKIDEILSLDYANSIAASAINVNEGGYEISADIVRGEKFENYNVTVTNGILTITKRPLEVYISSAEKIYDGQPYPEGSYSFTVQEATADKGIVDNISDVLALQYRGSALTAVDYSAISYRIEADIIEGYKFGNYDVTVHTATLTIKQRPIKIEAVGSQKIYDGTPGSVSDFGYQVIDVDENKFFGFVAGESFGEPIYGGLATTNKNVGTHNLTVSFSPSGEYIKNYAVTYVPSTYVISAKPLTVVLSNVQMVYNGSAPSKDLFVYDIEGLVEGESLGSPTYSGDAVRAVNASDNAYELKITGFSNTAVAKNYIIDYAQIKSELTISPKPITVTVKDCTMTYNGGAYNFKASDFTIDELQGSDTNSDFKFEFSGGGVDSNVYTISVVLSDNGNYTVTQYIDGTLTINPKPIKIKADDKTVTYNATSYTPTSTVFTASADALVGADTLADLGTLTFSNTATENAQNAGTYTISVELTEKKTKAKNYSISYDNGTFTIAKKSIYIKADDVSKTYDKQVYSYENFTAYVVDDALEGGHKLSDLGTVIFSGEATSAVNYKASGYKIIVRLNELTELADNYKIIYDDTNTGILTINKAPLTVTVNDSVHQYDSLVFGDFSVSANGFAEGDSLASLGTITYSTYMNNVRKDAVNVGTYTVRASVSAGTNYDIVFNEGTLTITAKELKLDPVADDKAYDGKTNDFGVNATGLAINDTVEMLGDIEFYGDTDKINVGEAYTVYIRLTEETEVSRNYNISYGTDTFAIKKKNINIVVNGQDKAYDGKEGTVFTVDSDDVVSGESLASLGEIKPVYEADGVAAVAKNVGKYTVSVDVEALNASLANYHVVTCTYSTFNITPAKLTVSVSAADREYDGTGDNEFSTDAKGLAEGETLEMLGDAVISTSRDGVETEAVEAGTYTVKVTIVPETEEEKAHYSNYEIEYQYDTDFVISPKAAE